MYIYLHSYIYLFILSLLPDTYICIYVRKFLALIINGKYKYKNVFASLSLSLSIVIYKALCFDVAQGRMNWTPNENSLSLSIYIYIYIYMHI